jgi:hypothetical protein
MQANAILDNLYNAFIERIREGYYAYLLVNHSSPEWRRRGRIIIIIATLLSIMGWLNFGVEIVRAVQQHPIPLSTMMLQYLLINVITVGLQLVPIYWARGGKVKRAAIFLMLNIICGLIARFISTGLTDWDQTMMTALIQAIPLAGAILEPEMSLIVAVIICIVESIVIYLYVPGLPQYILPTVYLINLATGAIMWGVLRPMENEIKSAEALESYRQKSSEINHRLEIEWLQAELTIWADQNHRSTLSKIQALATMIEGKETAIGSDTRDALTEIQDAAWNITRDWKSLLESSPTGLLHVETRLRHYPVNMLLTGVEREWQEHRAALAGVQVMRQAGSDIPAQAYGSPPSLRRILIDLIDCIGRSTQSRTVMMAAQSIDANHYEISLHGAAPIKRRWGSRKLSLETTTGEWAWVLRNIRRRLAMMDGTLIIEADANQPQSVVLRLPVNPPASD